MKLQHGAPGVAILLALVCVACGLAAFLYTPAPQPSRQVVVARRARPRLPTPKPFEFPAGGRVLANTYRFVALYGSPDSPPLGILGAQGLPDTMQRTKDISAVYQPLSTQPIYPTWEIISTIASEWPTDNNDYSREVDLSLLTEWVQAARAANIYVVLDLQPGRTDFLTQAKSLETLLRLPNVGLALDPEWRLGPNQKPIEQIGSVGAAEVNAVIAWLSDLVDAQKLPQKLLVLHQFRYDMLPDRQQIDTSHTQLAYMIQMDGQGGQPAKQDTWRAIMDSPPANTNFGWKNFYAKDNPMLDPAATMQVSPTPWYISYQ